MKNKYVLLTILFCLGANAQVQWPEVKIETRVSDESGAPISNATVSVWFSKLKTNNPFDGQDTVGSKGFSDATGNFSAISQTLGSCGVVAKKEGYYPSRVPIQLSKHKDGKWEPFHQVIEVMLRKKEMPIPMYAKRLNYFELPTTNSPVGYDLMAGDWVSPDGKGLVTDVVVTPEREFQEGGSYRWKLTLQAAKEGDGFSPIMPDQESPQSELRFPRTAPADGYSINPLVVEYKYGKGKSEYTTSAGATNFFFRVRTELDENKQVKQALYGKLIGPVEAQFHYVKTGKLRFTYYLNPTSLNRNMEFDPKKNLFQKLPSMERVTAP
jgi:hypothetical protein